MPVSSNAQLRLKARNALKRELPVALLVTLIACLPNLISQAAQLPLTQALNALVNDFASGRVSDDALTLRTMEILRSQTGFIAEIVSLVCALLVPFLALGWNNYTLKLLRGEETSVMDALSRAGCFFKALWLYIRIALMALLWALPGLLVIYAPIVLAILLNSQAVLNTVPFFMLIGFGLTVWLVLRAVLRRAMAGILLADDPAKRVSDCLRESKTLMQGRLMQYISVILPIVILLIPLSLIAGAVNSLSLVLGLTLSMAGELVINAYLNTAKCAFYLESTGNAECRTQNVE